MSSTINKYIEQNKLCNECKVESVLKYVLCAVTLFLLIVDVFIFFDFKKYIKVHENELVENHIKGLLGRAIAMVFISLCVGIIGIILRVV